MSWPDRAPLGGLAPRRRWFVLAVTAIVAVLAVVLTTGLVREYSPPAAADPSRPGTVVLVPGYGGNQGALRTLAARLTATGRHAVVVDLPAGGTGDLHAQAATVDDTVRDLLRHGETSVDLVGYSAGGVASWLYLTEQGTAPAVRRVVTLGSPLQGAELASVGGALVPGACPQACQQLAPGSSVLSGLRAAPRPAVPWLSVWTTSDDVVAPPDSAALPGLDAVSLQSVCRGARVTHSQLPTTGLAAGLVLTALGTGPLPRPGPADCTRLQELGVGHPLRSGATG